MSPDPHKWEETSKRGRKGRWEKESRDVDVLERQMLCSGWESENKTGDDGLMGRRRKSVGHKGLKERRERWDKEEDTEGSKQEMLQKERRRKMRKHSWDETAEVPPVFGSGPDP